MMIPMKKHEIIVALAIFSFIGCASTKKEIEGNLNTDDRDISALPDSTIITGPTYKTFDRIVKADYIYIISTTCSDTIKTKKLGEIIRVYDEDLSDNSLKVVENDSIIGYVKKAGGLGIVKGSMMVTSITNIRTNRNTNSSKIGQIEKYNSVDVDSFLNGWYRVPNYLGKVGYIHSKFLQTYEDYYISSRSPEEIKWEKNKPQFIEAGREIINGIRGYNDREFANGLSKLIALSPLAEEIVKPLKKDPNCKLCWALLSMIEYSKNMVDYYNSCPFLNPLALMGGDRDYYRDECQRHLKTYMNYLRDIDADWPLKGKAKRNN
jgi:hypothetical protein